MAAHPANHQTGAFWGSSPHNHRNWSDIEQLPSAATGPTVDPDFDKFLASLSVRMLVDKEEAMKKSEDGKIGAPEGAEHEVLLERRQMLKTSLAVGIAAGVGLLGRPVSARATGLGVDTAEADSGEESGDKPEEVSVYETPFAPNGLIFNADMNSTTIVRTALTKAAIIESDISSSEILRTNVEHSTLESVTFDSSVFKNCSLREVIIENADIEGLWINGYNVSEYLPDS